MGVTEFSPKASTSGYISYSRFGGFSVNTGTSIISGRTIPEYRGFLSYNTNGGIPNKAVVTKVELYVHPRTITQSGTNPTDWKNQFNMGTWIGSFLTSADWNGGTAVYTKDWATVPTAGYIDLGSSALNYYNNSGDTDVSILDASEYNFGNGNWSFTGTESYYKLRVTWHLPQVIKIN